MKKRDLLYVVLILLFEACGGEEESAQSKAMQLLTNNSSKSWSIYEYSMDEQQAILSPCDSSYVLTMKSDFTWGEQYTKLYCNQSSTGQWSLSGENNIITINYVDWSSGLNVERKFEIIELSETHLTYQFPVRNVLKRIRMQVYD